MRLSNVALCSIIRSTDEWSGNVPFWEKRKHFLSTWILNRVSNWIISNPFEKWVFSENVAGVQTKM